MNMYMDMNMNGHTMEEINYAVCVEWGIDSDEKDYCNGTLSKLKPEDKEEAYNNDGFNFVGKGGREGTEYYCYATVSEAIKNAAYNPFRIEYCGDFTEEEIKELHLAISEMYEKGKLDGYKIHDAKSLVDNFINDFDKYRTKVEKE